MKSAVRLRLRSPTLRESLHESEEKSVVVLCKSSSIPEDARLIVELLFGFAFASASKWVLSFFGSWGSLGSESSASTPHKLISSRVAG